LSALLVASLKPSSPSDHLCNTVLPIFTGLGVSYSLAMVSVDGS
jgi:hypothetical protein